VFFSLKILYPTIPVGMLEVRILGFNHPPCCQSISPGEWWLVLLSNRNKCDDVYTSLFHVFEWKRIFIAAASITVNRNIIVSTKLSDCVSSTSMEII